MSLGCHRENKIANYNSVTSFKSRQNKADKKINQKIKLKERKNNYGNIKQVQLSIARKR